MANMLKITLQKYCLIENGQADISFVVLENIANCLDTSISILVGEGDKERDSLVNIFLAECKREDLVEDIEIIEEILRVFHMHEKLYFQQKMKTEQ